VDRGPGEVSHRPVTKEAHVEQGGGKAERAAKREAKFAARGPEGAPKVARRRRNVGRKALAQARKSWPANRRSLKPIARP